MMTTSLAMMRGAALLLLAESTSALVVGTRAPLRARAAPPVALDFFSQFMPKSRPTDAEVTKTVYFDITSEHVHTTRAAKHISNTDSSTLAYAS